MPNRNDTQDAIRYSTFASVAVDEGCVLTPDTLELARQVVAQGSGYYTIPGGTYTITINGESTTTRLNPGESYFSRAYRDEFEWRGGPLHVPVKRNPKNYKNKKRASGASLP